MTTLNLLRVRQLRMTLYAEGGLTTMKVTMTILDLGSSAMVIDKVVVPRGEMESLVNPMRVEAMGVRSFSIMPSFWKASRYRTSTKLPISTIILLTWVLAILIEITKASSWSGYLASLARKVISGSSLYLGHFSMVARE